jgi:hypothetical protein
MGSELRQVLLLLDPEWIRVLNLHRRLSLHARVAARQWNQCITERMRGLAQYPSLTSVTPTTASCTPVTRHRRDCPEALQRLAQYQDIGV